MYWARNVVIFRLHSLYMKRPSRRVIVLASTGVLVVAVVVFSLLFLRNSSSDSVTVPLTSELYTIDWGFDDAGRAHAQQRFDNAQKNWQEAVLKGERDISLLLRLGDAYYGMGELGRAISSYNEILRTHPTDLPALENKGRALLDAKQYAEAERVWRQALELPNVTETTVLRVVDLVLTHLPDRRADLPPVLELGLVRFGQTVGLMLAHGRYYQAIGNVEQAIKHYEIVKTLDPKRTKVMDKLIAEVRAL